MAVKLALVGVSPASNPDKLTFQATFTGNYGVNGTGDPLNLAPYDVNNNPGGWTNPENIPAPEMPFGLEQAPSVIAENIGGSYVTPAPSLAATGATNGVAKTLGLKSGLFLIMYEPGGAEKATNAAYTASELAGSVLIEMVLPKDQ
jgi:hypothetical protein